MQFVAIRAICANFTSCFMQFVVFENMSSFCVVLRFVLLGRYGEDELLILYYEGTVKILSFFVLAKLQ